MGAGTKTYKKFKTHERIISTIFLPVRHGFEALMKYFTSDNPDEGVFLKALVEEYYGYDDYGVGTSVAKIFLNIFVFATPGLYYMQKKAPAKAKEVAASDTEQVEKPPTSRAATRPSPQTLAAIGAKRRKMSQRRK